MEEWFKKMVNSHIDKNNNFNVESFKEEYNSVAPKYTIPKRIFNEKNEECKSFKRENSELRKELSHLKNVEEAYKQSELKKALKASHCKDVDFTLEILNDRYNEIKSLIYFDSKYTLHGIKSVIDELKNKHPYLFVDSIKIDNRRLTNTKYKPQN